jgi:opacity protein-like surface antigen
MRKILLALVVCAIMVNAATAVVSAKPVVKLVDVRQYDMKFAIDTNNDDILEQYVFGKLTVKVLSDGTGTYVVNMNVQKLSELYDLIGYNLKQEFKETLVGVTSSMSAYNSAATPDYITFGSITINEGGVAHGAGTLDAATVTWLDTWGSDPGTTLAF